MNTETLNRNEVEVLRAAFGSSKGNGHDFGFVEDVLESRIVGIERKQIRGYLSDLQKKGWFKIENEVINGFTQFVMPEEAVAAAAKLFGVPERNEGWQTI